MHIAIKIADKPPPPKKGGGVKLSVLEYLIPVNVFLVFSNLESISLLNSKGISVNSGNLVILLQVIPVT